MSQGFNQLPASVKDIQPFQVSISDEDINELNQLLKLSRIAPPTYETSQEDRRYGVTTKWLTEAKDHWLNNFSWKAEEARINSFPNFIASIEHEGSTCKVHFIALFSQKPDAVPVISLHGWPGSFLEFLPQLELTAKAYSPSDLPYHLIIPSLQGYAFSSGPPKDRHFTIHDTSAILNELMIGKLGFERYVATGGDIGAGIARILARKYEECQGLLLNFCSMDITPEKEAITLESEFEVQCVERVKSFFVSGAAYAAEQGTRPGTLGLVLESNPLSLLAWVGEKFLAWSDEDPSLDTILADVSLYWFTKTISRCFYPYRQRYEKSVAVGHAHPELKVEGKPFGYQLFPKEIYPTPRAWVATTGTLSWYRQHDAGGHFAALEQPAQMKSDLEDFLKHVQEQNGESKV